MRYFLSELKCNGGFHNKLTVATYRIGNLIYYNLKIPLIRQIVLILHKVIHFIIISIIGGGILPYQTKIGYNLELPHNVNGIVIHPKAIIGNNVTIFHQVTIGTNRFNKINNPPTIGDNVFIGAGAKIIGNITIGNNVRIGANAVVVKDVPSNSTVVGIPAKIVI